MKENYKAIFKDLPQDNYSQFSVPFVFKNNFSAFLQWSIKFENFKISRLQTIDQLQKAENTVDLNVLTQNRLALQKKAYQNQLSQIETLLSEFGFSKQQGNTQAILQHRVPSQQHFDSYFKNIFRDWAWGEEENKIYSDCLKKLTLNKGKVLIVGGGAGRLAYDLAQQKPEVEIIQIDINPLLSLIAHKICNAETIELCEISQFPMSTNDVAISHLLKTPTPVAPSQIQFVVGDISDHPFKDQQFDAIICPWVIDIISENFADFAKRLNFLLKPQGELLIFGPLSFEKQSAQHKLTAEEVVQVLQESGFKNLTTQKLKVPYLHSPIEALIRHETIHLFYSQQEKPSKRPKSYQHYPNWLSDTSVKVQPNQSLISLQSQKNLEAQFLAGLLSGKSIHEMATHIASSGSGMNLKQAEDFIQSVFARLFETGDIKAD